MTPDADYESYVAALTAAIDLPRAQAAELDDIARRARNDIDALDRSRREAADRWVGMRDNTSRLSRRVGDLADRVGAAPPSGVDDHLLSPDALPHAIDTLRADVDRADQSWQWVLRQRERAIAAPPPPPAPVYTPPPAPAPPPPVAPTGGNTSLLLIGGAVVIVVLVIVIVVLVV